MRNLPTACRLQFHQHGSCFLDQGLSSLQSIEKLTPPVFPSPFNPTHRHETAAAIRHRHETAAAIRGAGELVGAPRLGPPPGAQRRPPLPLVAHTRLPGWVSKVAAHALDVAGGTTRWEETGAIGECEYSLFVDCGCVWFIAEPCQNSPQHPRRSLGTCLACGRSYGVATTCRSSPVDFARPN